MLEFLFVEDNVDDFELAVWTLKKWGFQFNSRRVTKEDQFLEELANVDMIFADCSLPGFDCIAALAIWKSKGLEDVPFIILSGTITDKQAITFQDLGAIDVVLKKDLKRLGIVTKRALAEVKIKNQVRLSKIDEEITHKINNCLTVICANANYCLFQGIEGDFKECLVAIETACKKISKIIKNLGNFK